MRHDSRQLPEKPDIGIVRAAIEDVEPGSPFGPGLFGSVLRRQTYQARSLDAQRGFVVLADDEQVVPALGAKDANRRILDGNGFTQPGPAGARRRRPGGAIEQVVEKCILAYVGRSVAFENNLRCRRP